MDYEKTHPSLTSRDVTIFGKSGRSEGSRGYQFVCMYYASTHGTWELVYDPGAGGAVDRSGFGSPPSPNAVKVKISRTQKCRCVGEDYANVDWEWTFGPGGFFYYGVEETDGYCTGNIDGHVFADLTACPSLATPKEETEKTFSFADMAFDLMNMDLDIGDVFDDSTTDRELIKERQALLRWRIRSMLSGLKKVRCNRNRTR